jgi:DNA-directed RNA polymerase II subunit RPB1
MEFGLFDPDVVERMSVVSIENERIYAEDLTPNHQGINDQRMGTMDRNRMCLTCKCSQVECPGHFGHIKLAVPVYHHGFIEFVRKVLRCICPRCSKVLLQDSERERFMQIPNTKSRFYAVFKHCDSATECKGEKGCGAVKPKYTTVNLEIYKEGGFNSRNEEGNGGGEEDSRKLLKAEDCRRLLMAIPSEDLQVMGFNE